MQRVPTQEQLHNHRHEALKAAKGELAELMEYRDDLQLRTFAFHSSANINGIGSINLGGHKSIKSNPVDIGGQLVMHNTSQRLPQKDNFSGSLNATKFHKGFQRRMECDITNELKDAEERNKIESEDRKSKMRNCRMQEMKTRASGSGFNILTGKVIDQNAIPQENSFKKTLNHHHTNGLGPEAPARGFSILRESPVGRFHQPQNSGNNHDYRQEMLCKEGINKPKYTGILAVGKGDLPSYGVEDQFSKSEYDKNRSHLSKQGLHEARMPGKYTPRKQEGNPSGDPIARAHWATGFQLG